MDYLITIPEDQRNDKSVFLDFPKQETFEKYDSLKHTKDVVHNEYQFCRGMGFEVKEKYSYNGVPTASIIKLNKMKSGWDKPKGVAVVPMSFSESFKLLIRNCTLMGVFLFWLSIVASVFYAFYLFNLYQIKLEEENEKKAERQRRIDNVKRKRAERRAEKERLEKELAKEVDGIQKEDETMESAEKKDK